MRTTPVTVRPDGKQGKDKLLEHCNYLYATCRRYSKFPWLSVTDSTILLCKEWRIHGKCRTNFLDHLVLFKPKTKFIHRDLQKMSGQSSIRVGEMTANEVTDASSDLIPIELAWHLLNSGGADINLYVILPCRSMNWIQLSVFREDFQISMFQLWRTPYRLWNALCYKVKEGLIERFFWSL